MVSGVLEKEGATVWYRAVFYKAVVQEFLLYTSDIWVIMDAMMKVLEGLHHHINQRIAGKTICQVGVEGWECPPVVEALEATVMWNMWV